VIGSDLPVLAQLGTGDSVRFEIIEHSDAEKMYIENEQNIGVFRTGIGLSV
jgi:allophanate hydrolase subunit 2